LPARAPPKAPSFDVLFDDRSQALWKYIKANDLQDPDLRTDILPDDQLKVRTVSEIQR
jgi:hypothetical protein